MKINKNIIGLLLVIIILLIGAYNYLKISTKSKEASLQVINVLDKDLYDDSHIKGSINVPFDRIEEYAKDLDKNTHVVLYCSNYMCTASGAAARMFMKNGFENVWVYSPGTAGWLQEGEPVEGPSKEPYLKEKIEKPETQEEGVQPITTQELKDKIKKMLKIPGY